MVNQGWQDFNFIVGGTGSLVDLAFSGNSGGFLGLDNVDVTIAVPEPATVLAGAMMLLPLGVGAARFVSKSRLA